MFMDFSSKQKQKGGKKVHSGFVLVPFIHITNVANV